MHNSSGKELKKSILIRIFAEYVCTCVCPYVHVTAYYSVCLDDPLKLDCQIKKIKDKISGKIVKKTNVFL